MWKPTVSASLKGEGDTLSKYTPIWANCYNINTKTLLPELYLQTFSACKFYNLLALFFYRLCALAELRLSRLPVLMVAAAVHGQLSRMDIGSVLLRSLLLIRLIHLI